MHGQQRLLAASESVAFPLLLRVGIVGIVSIVGSMDNPDIDLEHSHGGMFSVGAYQISRPKPHIGV
jgi:hypothetical protein